VIEVKSVLKLNMVTNFVCVGVSFRQASRLYQSVKEETGMGIMGSILDDEVAHHCRIVCAVNLQYLKEIFKNVWAFCNSNCVQGTCTQLSNECHGNICQIWCGAHQLDLIVKKAFNYLMNETFLKTLTGVTGHL